jgi:acyl carrier protein
MSMCPQVSADEPLMAAGLDSLGSVELRNTLEASLALTLPPTLVMDYPTAAAIAAYAAAKMPVAQQQPAATQAASRQPVVAAASEPSWDWFEGADTLDGSSFSDLDNSFQPTAAPAQPLAAVESDVAAVVAGILGRPIGSSDALMASGLDSLASVELQNVLQASYAMPLPATLALDYPSVSAIAGFIHSKLAGAAAGAQAQGKAAAVQRAPVAAAAVVSQPLGVFGMAFVLPGAGRADGRFEGFDAITAVPLERYVNWLCACHRNQ